MSAARKPVMTADEFLDWSADQPDDGRYELLDGVVTAMAPERYDHAALKFAIARRLADQVDRRQLSCTVLVDGIGVRVGEQTLFIPDVLVRCAGSPVAPEQREINDPMILIEVLSPSTRHIDSGQKFVGYFALASVRHYMIVSPEGRAVVHHRRGDDGVIQSSTVAAWPLLLDPPGLVLEDIFPAETS